MQNPKKVAVVLIFAAVLLFWGISMGIKEAKNTPEIPPTATTLSHEKVHEEAAEPETRRVRGPQLRTSSDKVVVRLVIVPRRVPALENSLASPEESVQYGQLQLRYR